MIDWLGARRPIDVVLLMTAVLSLGMTAIEHVVLPAAESFVHAPT